MIRRCNIVNVDSSTALVAGYIGASGCNCSCADCSGCIDCTSCPNLTVGQLNLVVSRAGVCPYVALFSYPAYDLIGNIVYFYIDSNLTSLVGRYIGKITVTSGMIVTSCGQIEMQVGDSCGVFNPFTVTTTNLGIGDLNPS
jgi:hypothetical protein